MAIFCGERIAFCFDFYQPIKSLRTMKKCDGPFCSQSHLFLFPFPSFSRLFYLSLSYTIFEIGLVPISKVLPFFSLLYFFPLFILRKKNENKFFDYRSFMD